MMNVYRQTTSQMKTLQILLLLLVCVTVGVSQSSFGLEFRTSKNITFNSSAIEGIGLGFETVNVTKEGNPVTLSYSVGLLYHFNQNHTFKIHFGRHRNGRIFDVTIFDDTLTSFMGEGVDIPYDYFQVVPSYAYSFSYGKFSLPLELGFALNKRINQYDIFYFVVSEYNFDLRLSGGVKYTMNNFYLGGNMLFSKAIYNYDLENTTGHFDPFQFGVEVCVGYKFGEKASPDNAE